MQDLASEFSKIFRGWYPRTLTAAGGDPLPYPTPNPALDRARGASAPVLGPKLWSPQLFSRGCAPGCDGGHTCCILVSCDHSFNWLHFSDN